MPNPNDIIDPQTQENLKQQQAQDEERQNKNFNIGGGGAGSTIDTGTFGQTYTPAPPNTKIAYSGSDCKAFIVTYGQVAKDSFIPLTNLSAISYSIHRDKAPVRRLGHYIAEDYTKGTRTVAGSIVIINFDRAAFFELVSGFDIYGAAGENIEVADNIPPFDIMLAFSEENKGRHSSLWHDGKIGPDKPEGAADFSYMWIRNVHFVDEGSVTGTEEAYLETTFQYVAEQVEYLKPNNVTIGTSPIANIASTVGGSPSTSTYQRANPHRHFADQHDEIADWDTGSKQMNLIFDRKEVSNFEAEFAYTVSTVAESDAIKTAGSDPHEWVRPDTQLIYQDSDVPIHMLGNMQSITELTVSGLPEGANTDPVQVMFESFHPDPDITNNNIIHITNAHLFHDYERNCWEKLWGLEKPPIFGNKFQDDLHNVARAEYEEFTETLVYDGTTMVPGNVDFVLQGEADASVLGFSNDVDQHSFAKSGVKEHTATITPGTNPGDPATVTIVVDEADVQSTVTDSFKIDFTNNLLLGQEVSRQYVNNSFDRIDVDIYIYESMDKPSLIRKPHLNPVPFIAIPKDQIGSEIGVNPNQIELKDWDMYKTPQVAPDHCDNAYYTTQQDCENAGNAWYTGQNVFAKFTLSVPGVPLVPRTASTTRSGPGFTAMTHNIPITFDAASDTGSTSIETGSSSDPMNHTIRTANSYQFALPSPSLNAEELKSTSTITGPEGGSYGGFINVTQHDDIIDAEGVLIGTTIKLEGFNQEFKHGEELASVPPASNTQQITQDIGTYVFDSNSNIQNFQYTGDAETHNGDNLIMSHDDLLWDWTDTSVFHPDFLPNQGYTVTSFDGTGSFQVSGVRDWRFSYQRTGLLSTFTDQYAYIGDTFPVSAAYQDKIQFRYGGSNNMVHVTIESAEGYQIASGLKPIDWSSGSARVSLNSFGIPSNGGTFTITDFSQDPWISYQAVRVILMFDYKYIGDIPLGLKYTTVDPTPLSTSFFLDSGGTGDITKRVYDPPSFNLLVEQSDGLTNDAATWEFNANGNGTLEVNNLKPNVTSNITFTYDFKYNGVFDINMNYQSYADTNFPTEVTVDLGSDEPQNFNKETDVVLSCANSLAQIQPTPFGIIVEDPALNVDTNNWEVKIKDIPGMVVHDHHEGWFASQWQGIWGDPTMPEGNIKVDISYNVFDSTIQDQIAAVEYASGTHPVTGADLTFAQAVGTELIDGITVSKVYDGDEYKKIRIVNPGMHSSTSDACSDTQFNNENECKCGAGGVWNGVDCTTGTETANTWTVGSVVTHSPVDITPGGANNSDMGTLVITEITDYDNMPTPSELTFNVDGVSMVQLNYNPGDSEHGHSGNSIETVGQTDFTFDLTYDIQKGELPIEFTYLRKTGDVYPNILTDILFKFEAEIPIFKHDPAVNSEVVLDIIDKVYFCGNAPELPPANCRNATVPSGNPVEVQAIVPIEDTNGVPCDDPTVPNVPEGCNQNYGQIIGPDTFNVTDPLQAYTLLRNPSTTSGSPFTIEFPTGMNPILDNQGVNQALLEAANPPYQIDVDYRSLVSFMPSTTYDSPGYLLTAVLNITGQDAFVLVLDIDNNSLNYYRGFGACSDTQYTDMASCVENDGTWTENVDADTALCSDLGGSYIMETPTIEAEINAGILKPAGICQLSTTSIDQLIQDQKFVQFSYKIVGPGTNGSTTMGKPIYQIFESSENFSKLDDAVSAMQAQYDELFGT